LALKKYTHNQIQDQEIPSFQSIQQRTTQTRTFLIMIFIDDDDSQSIISSQSQSESKGFRIGFFKFGSKQNSKDQSGALFFTFVEECIDPYFVHSNQNPVKCLR